MSDIGNYLMKIRQEQQISIRQLAKLTGISHSEINKIENGERENPSPLHIKSIAKVFGISQIECLKIAGYIDEDAQYPLPDFLSNFSPEELDECISRIETINKLKKKYGNSIEEILAYADENEKKLYDIDNIDEERENLEAELSVLNDQLKLASERLTVLRKKSAEELEGKISRELLELNFAESNLSISFDTLPSFTENGIDKVEFLISTNKGEPLLARRSSH